ncbi:hypothetical protein N2152v2_006710 [Parachlorella kessleri]
MTFWATKCQQGFRFVRPVGLHAYRPPRPPIDLNEGRESYVAKAGNDKGDVETVIQAAASAGAALSDCDVVTFRNNLNKIAGTPLDPMTTWSVDACWKGSKMYLDIVQLEPQWRGNVADPDKFAYWGYRFEAACTGQQVTDSSSEYCILVRTRLGGIRILLGAEIDCYDPTGVCGNKQPGLSSYLELKTYKPPQHPKQQLTLHRNKHPRWWLQSFLAGVPALALGARDDQGLVHKIDLVKVADLPRISAASGAAWDPQLALRFGEHCLKWMRSVAAAHAEQHVRFTYDSSNRVVRYELLAGS